MRGHDSNEGFHGILPGIRIKTLVHGEESLMTKFILKAGSELPSHSHPYEQIGYLIQGRLRLAIGGEVRETGPGDSWCIPSGLEHRAEILEDSVALEIFSPVREDYIKYMNPQDVLRAP
jgi:quercetin dioxygenase-like cupin family protein